MKMKTFLQQNGQNEKLGNVNNRRKFNGNRKSNDVSLEGKKTEHSTSVCKKNELDGRKICSDVILKKR